MKWFIGVLLLSLSLHATLLHEAVTHVDLEEVTDLLWEEGCDINAVDEDGNTALHIAVYIGRLSIIKALLTEKPNLYIKNRRGYTPLALAIDKNRMKTITLLLKAQKHAKKPVKYALLHQAVLKRDFLAQKHLILLGYNVNRENAEGITPFHLSAKVGDLEIFKYMLESGGDLYKSDYEGRDVLYYARYGRNKDIIKIILEKREEKNNDKK